MNPLRLLDAFCRGAAFDGASSDGSGEPLGEMHAEQLGVLTQSMGLHTQLHAYRAIRALLSN
jgi:hypothetical protein